MMTVLGRACISIIFIVFGVSAIFSWDLSYTDLDAALVNWQMQKTVGESLGGFLDVLVRYIPILLGVGIFFQIAGGALVFLGVKYKLGALMLAIYLVFNTLLYFPFWFYEGDQFTFTLVLFLKNLAIFGGILLLLGSKRRGSTMVEMVEDEL
jgi:uncharacterized membrane protein YphA (DoxX/SURF4 family)